MPPDRTISIAVGSDHVIRCKICDEPVAEAMVAALTRSRPGDAFDPWCKSCFRHLVSMAKDTADLVEAIEIIF